MIEHDISWDEYFIGEAYDLASRSKDPSRKVGCVIARNSDHREMGRGVNGLPRGIKDTMERYLDPDFKAACVLHAEENAVQIAERYDLSDCTAYISWHPCAHCTGLMIGRGIRRFVIGPQEEPVSEKWQKNFAFAQTLLVEVGAETLMVTPPHKKLDVPVAAPPSVAAAQTPITTYETGSLLVGRRPLPAASSRRANANIIGRVALLVSPAKKIGVLAKIDGFKDAVTDRLSLSVREEYAIDENAIGAMRRQRQEGGKAEWSEGGNLFYYPQIGHAYDLGPFDLISTAEDHPAPDGWFSDGAFCERLVMDAILKAEKR